MPCTVWPYRIRQQYLQQGESTDYGEDAEALGRAALERKTLHLTDPVCCRTTINNEQNVIDYHAKCHVIWNNNDASNWLFIGNTCISVTGDSSLVVRKQNAFGIAAHAKTVGSSLPYNPTSWTRTISISIKLSRRNSQRIMRLSKFSSARNCIT